MNQPDKYADIAERYGQMLEDDPKRRAFFKSLFERHGVRSVLDCSCGTGNDLLLFHSMGYYTVGSDLSDSMLKVASELIKEQAAEISLRKADFHKLKAVHKEKFDAVVCLSNSINEVEVDPLVALSSMKDVLNPNGIIVVDQGQTDLTMKDPPSFAPIINNKDLSRLFTMTYHGGIMTVNVFDFVHDADSRNYDFSHSEFDIRIRLLREWKMIFERSLLEVEYYGNWEAEMYDAEKSKRLIMVAKRKG
jgi:ubiquinone/menaquinone biosynthesis C-methylase UbiE